jgi:hypothetical protein
MNRLRRADIALSRPSRLTSRQTRRVAVGFVVAFGSLLGSYSSAAGLGAGSSQPVGAMQGALSKCDTDGVTLTYGTHTYDPTIGNYRFNSVTISGINPACAGKRLEVTLRNATNGAQGSGFVAAIGGSGTESVSISGTTNANSVVGVSVLIKG